jgi:DNA replication and repair protein RecF
MHVSRLELEEFRLYRRLSIELPPSGLRIFGGNASGKSTLVEALAMLATLRSPRTASDREVINFQSGMELGFPPYAKIVAETVTSSGPLQIEVGLQIDTEADGALRKSVKLNGRPVRAIDAVGGLRTVLFSPEDVTLLAGPPSGRRRYLDLFISQIDNRYIRALARYNRITEQRNSLLKALGRNGQIGEFGGVASQLAFWNEELVSYGAYLIAKRRVVVEGLAHELGTRFATFVGAGTLGVSYVGTAAGEVPPVADGESFETFLQRVQRAYELRVGELQIDELRRGMTLAGPHRDDMRVTLEGVELGTFGSRGQQRLAVVALKLAEAALMQSYGKEAPVVLLDDVLSELDAEHRQSLLNEVSAAGAQLVITSTDRHLVEAPGLEQLPLYRASAGALEPV